MKKGKIWFWLAALALNGLLSGCGALKDSRDRVTAPEPVVVENGQTLEDGEGQSGGEAEPDAGEPVTGEQTGRSPVKVKGIYISAYVAGTPDMVDSLLEELDRTEANALVIDLKDDFGRIACAMDSPLVQEIGSSMDYIKDVEGLMKKLDEHGVYAIARIPAFRDKWIGQARPDWCVKNADGTVFYDRDGNAWVNPYKEEAWDYLVEIGIQAKKLGFDEVQFDYVRFCTESGMKNAVFDEADVRGRSRTDIISEFVEYAYSRLKDAGLFVSADVFGAIIGSSVDADSVGQIYGEMAKHLDYISPMIYPSHYGDGNYGIDHPDTKPYDTICAALGASRKDLYFAGLESDHVAKVRPWLQDFTATWLKEHIAYGAAEVREQIQATYDCGYDEWLLWDAACTYDWDGLLTPDEAAAEKERIAESRALLPETTYAPETTSPAASAAAAAVSAAAETTMGPPPETGTTLPQAAE